MNNFTKYQISLIYKATTTAEQKRPPELSKQAHKSTLFRFTLVQKLIKWHIPFINWHILINKRYFGGPKPE